MVRSVLQDFLRHRRSVASWSTETESSCSTELLTTRCVRVWRRSGPGEAGIAWQARLGMARSGAARLGMAGKARRGRVRPGAARQVLAKRKKSRKRRNAYGKTRRNMKTTLSLVFYHGIW